MVLSSEQDKLFLKFLIDNKDKYSQYCFNYILDYYNTNLEEASADIIWQIYSHVGIINKNIDRYDGFFKLIKKEFGVDKNIIDVGCGFIPVLCEKIDKAQQEIGKGSITGYDPNLIMTDLGKIKLYKKLFEVKDNISKFDLVVGFFPCEATELIIEKACGFEKDFIVGLCGCDHRNIPYFGYYNPDTWEDYIIDETEKLKHSNCNTKVVKLDKIYDNPYPIIIGKHNK